MSPSAPPRIGSIGWIDLTVDNAETVKDFYSAVTGWESSPVSMNGYDDFSLSPPDSSEPVAGICHARGSNADLPATWIIYITVADVDASARTCEALGGRVVVEPKNMGEMGRYCLIEDPAGAVAALFAYKP